MSVLEMLTEIRSYAGAAKTTGLKDAVVSQFADRDPSLRRAITEAVQRHRSMRADYADLLAMDEAVLTKRVQEDFLNFYPANCINPYVSLAAAGPWIVTAHGAVLHDSGGYGMLGFGHGPTQIIKAMSDNWVMANVMSPSLSQKRLGDFLRKEIGHSRGSCPYESFICLNSGSESVTVAARISDINAKVRTDPGGEDEGKRVNLLALKGGFHGRTDRPAQASDSTLPKYRANLYSHHVREKLITVEPNNTESLEAAFSKANEDGVFIEAVFIEPVMGEGNPGQAISRSFYDTARSLTKAHGSLLLVDSIQAGIRATGCLSIVDYPGFEDAEAPDMETYSKALNAGQYPLSVLALNERAANMYVSGVYGNTMTTNPRALEVACAVLGSITQDIRSNIVARGTEFVEKLEMLSTEFPGAIVSVRGTGLLLAAELNETLPVIGFGKIEEYCRNNGVGVIHGGKNALRFTPHFAITSEEVDAIIDVLRMALQHFWAE